MKKSVITNFLLMIGGLITLQAADINVSSLGPGNGADVVASSISGGADRLLASQFTVGAQSADISKVTVSLSNLGEKAYDLTRLTALIYSDSGNKPGSSLTSFTQTGSLNGDANQDFTGTLFSLSANTNYWLVLKASAASDINQAVMWYCTQSSSLAPVSGVNGAINTLSATSTDNGETWIPYTSPNLTYYDFAITNVPEPSTYALGLIATGVIVGAARRSRKA